MQISAGETRWAVIHRAKCEFGKNRLLCAFFDVPLGKPALACKAQVMKRTSNSIEKQVFYVHSEQFLRGIPVSGKTGWS